MPARRFRVLAVVATAVVLLLGAGWGWRRARTGDRSPGRPSAGAQPSMGTGPALAGPVAQGPAQATGEVGDAGPQEIVLSGRVFK
jgi:hypothetical protein